MKPSEITVILHSPLFRNVDSKKAAPLLSDEGVELRAIPKGKTIYSAASFSRRLCILLKGSARVEKENDQKRMIMSTLTKGSMFGMAALFYEEEEFPTVITALEDCEIVLFSKDWLRNCFAVLPETAENYITLLSARIHFLNAKIDTLSLRGDTNKLYSYLLSEYRRHGAGGNLALNYNMAELSKVLGVGRTTLYRELDALTADKRIEKHGKIITFLNLEEIS